MHVPTGSDEPLYGRTDTSLQRCIPRWSTSLAGRQVRAAMTTKCQAQAAEEEQRRLRGEDVRGQGVAHGRTDRGRAPARAVVIAPRRRTGYRDPGYRSIDASTGR